VDRYCDAQPEPIPCEGLGQPIIQPTQWTIEESLSYHWSDKVRRKQQELLAFIANVDEKGIPEEAFESPAKMAPWLGVLAARLQPVSVLSLGLPDPRPLEQQLRLDGVLQTLRLRLQIAERAKVIAGSIPAPGRESASELARLKALTAKDVDGLKADIAARERLLTAQFKQPAPPSSAADAGSIERLMVAGLTGIVVQLPYDPDFTVGAGKPTSAGRAALAARTLLLLDKVATDARTATLNVVQSQQNMQQDLRSRNVGNLHHLRSVETQLDDIHLPLMCSYQRDSAQVSATDSGKEPMPINIQPFACKTKLPEVDGEPVALSLHDSLQHSMNYWSQARRSDLEVATRKALVQAADKTRQAREGALQMSSMVPATIDLGRKRCRTLEPHTWGNCAVNRAKDKGEQTYASGRATADRSYRRKLAEAERQGNQTAFEQILLARREGLAALDTADREFPDMVAQVERGFQLVGILLTFFLILALIKSLLYSLALKLYAEGSPSFIRVDASRTVVGEAPRVAPLDYQRRSLDLEDVTPAAPLVTREYLSGQEQRNSRVPPWPFSGVLARLLMLRYFFYNVGGPMPGQKIQWNAGDGRSIIDWRLQPGEAVVFQYRHFVGASRRVRLHSRFSLRLDTMLFGRFNFAIAVAEDEPGHLLLGTRSVSPQAVADDQGDAVMVERLIAWHAGTPFQVVNTPKVASLFFDPYSLKRMRGQAPGRMVVDVTPVPAALHGAFRYALKAMSPF
jgi:hypothetical protein